MELLSTVKLIAPLPVPVLVVCNQFVLLTAVHAQPAPAVRPTLPLPAPAVTFVLARDLAVSGPTDGVSELAGGLLVRSLSGPSPKANANDKTLTLTLKPGETAVLGYSFR